MNYIFYLIRMFLIGFVVGYLITTAAKAEEFCLSNPIYCRIVELKPGINKSFAMELSNLISYYSKLHGTDPYISVAIAMQESSLRNIDRYETVIDKKGRYVRGVSDIGLFQMHVDTVRYLEIDVPRLRSDLEYQVYWHTKILKQKIHTCKYKKSLRVVPGTEWACYHSYTRNKRLKYTKDVSRWL